MADRTLKPDGGNDLVLQNDDGSAKIEINEDGSIAVTGSPTISGDLTVTGNDIKASGGTTSISLSGANVSVAGDLTVTGNDVKDSSGSTVFTFSSGKATVSADPTASLGVATKSYADSQSIIFAIALGIVFTIIG
jgi:uncharacterized protein (DUF2141 family)